jgi:hypothetical protein
MTKQPLKIGFFGPILSRISRFSNELLETREDQDFKNEELERGKKQDNSDFDLANQEGNKNIKMYKIEKIKNILLYSEFQVQKKISLKNPYCIVVHVYELVDACDTCLIIKQYISRILRFKSISFACTALLTNLG